MSLPPPHKNLYHHRRVAEANAKPCFICYRPATSVLITPDQADFFYTCPGHLQDRGFCSSAAGDGAEKCEREKVMQAEVEAVTREWEEKVRRRKEREAAKGKEGAEKEKEKEKGGGKGDKGEGKEKEKEKEKEEEKEEGEGGKEGNKKEEAAPRVFTLHKKVYDLRVQRIRAREQARRNQERLKNPNLLPNVPKGMPGV